MRKLLLLALLAITCSLWTSKLSAQDVINLGVNDSIGLAVRTYAGTSSSLIVTIPNGYTSPDFKGGKKLDLTTLPAVITDLTIQGFSTQHKDTLWTKQIEFPTRLLNSLTVKNLYLSGVDEVANPIGALYSTALMGNYLVNSTTAINITNLSFIGCSIANYRGMLRLQSSTPTIQNISFDNCVIRNIGYAASSYNLVNPIAGSTINTITLRNCSVYAFSGNILPLANVSSTVTSVTIDKCTFDQVLLGSTGKYVVDFGSTGSTTATVNITNSIFGRVTAANKGVRATGATTNYVNNYATTDWVLSSNIFTVTAYSGSVANLFTLPTSYNATNSNTTIGDYSILDQTFAGLGTSGAGLTAVNIPSVSNKITFNGREITLSEVSDVTVFSITGELIKSAKKTNVLTVSNLSRGIYVVKAGSSVQKIMIN